MTAVPAGDRDPIGDLAHVLDGLAGHVARVDGRARRSESNRLTLLHLHAGAAVLIGATFSTVNLAGPSWTVARVIPGAPVSMAALIGVAGVLLGVATHFRWYRWEITALWLLASWYALMCLSFAGALVVWYTGGAGARPALYPPVLYAHLTAIMLVHARTLGRMRRSERGGR